METPDLKSGIDENDDFEFGENKDQNKSADEKKSAEENNDDHEFFDDDEKNKSDKGSDKKNKTNDNATDDEDGGDDKGGKNKGGNDKNKSQENIDDDDDSAADDDDDLFGSDTKSDDNKKPTFSFKPLAKKYGFELDDDTQEEFETKMDERVEKAKGEVDLSKFSADAQKIIKHLNENDGKLEDFFNNKAIIQLQGIIGMDPQTKVFTVRIQELQSKGMNAAEARTKAEEEIGEMTKKEIREASDNINEDAGKLLNAEISKITDGRAEIAERKKNETAALTATETKQLKNLIDKQESFLGIKLSEKAKKAILADIETGEFDQIANKNKAVSKFNAYMLSKYGDKIMNKLNKTVAESSRKAHNDAVDKMTNQLHNTKDAAQRGSSGRNKADDSNKKNFSTWGDELFKE